MSEELATSRQMLTEVREGLQKPQKTLPSKYFYDERGSKLFEAITRLEEYYLTRTEISILQQNIEEIAHYIGSKAVIVELGSGSSKKTRLLLDHLHDLVAYLPIDISEEYLLKAGDSLRNEYPNLIIKPVVADYTQPFELPVINSRFNRCTAFYPGSTVGNFRPGRAQKFLGQVAKIIGPSGSLLIGVDLKKDKKTLENAYNDAEGITAAFNKNMLRRLNRELSSDFQTDRFEHDAFYNEEEGRIEMHLVSLADQTVSLDGEKVKFKNGESIHTEDSYKYSLEEFGGLVSDWYQIEKIWTDENHLFSLQFLTVK